MLDISDVNALRTIVELGSISRAAERLNISQPTLSKRIGRLEQKFGISLFHRSNDGMIATAATKYIISTGERVTQELKSIERHIQLLATLKAGRLNIGVGPIVEQTSCPAVLLEFAKSTQNIQLSMRVGSPAQLLQWLEANELDVAFGPFDVPNLPRELHSEMIAAEPVIAVARSGHPLSSRSGPLSPLELFSYPCIAPHLPLAMKQNLERMVGPTVAASFPSMACDNYEVCKSVVRNSDYFTAGPSSVFSDDIAMGKMVELNFPERVLWSAICIARPETLQIPAVKKIIELFHATLGDRR